MSSNMYNMHIKKERTTITIDPDLKKQAQELNVSISGFVDIELRRYLASLQNKNMVKNTLRGRFELPLPLRRTGSQGRRVRPDFATSA